MVDADQPDDRAAIRRCLDGETEAFGILVRHYMKRAFYTALAFVGDPDDALDISQDAFVRAFRAIRNFRPEINFFTWYYTILRNLCLNHIRNRRKREQTVIQGAEIGTIPDREPDPSVLAEENELNRILWRAMIALDPHHREIIILKDLQELSYREIAEMLGIPQGTVMSRLYHARKNLRKAAEGYL